MRIKKLLVLIMSFVLMFSVLGSVTFVSHGATSQITYSFSGTNSSDKGYAQGTITLTAENGTYWLYWADDTKALDGYTEIAKLSITSGSASHSMYKQTAIPADATKLIAIKSNTEPTSKTVANASAVYSIPVSKQFPQKSTEKKYSFASYSDVHMNSDKNAYKYCEEHFSKALETATNRNVDFIIGSGDYAHSESGSATNQANDWKLYEKVLANSSYCNPIYEAIGNHEIWPGTEIGTKNFINATGLEGSDNKSSKAYFEKTLNGDHYIFLALENGFYPNQVDEFSTEQLDWFESLLQKYSGDGHNIFVIEHSQFYSYGAGDRTTGTPYYGIPLTDDYASSKRLKSLLQAYKNTIFLSGHTHIAFSEQYNYSDNDGTSCQMIHNSSVGGTRHIENDALQYVYYLDQTEGYIVDVYNKGIVFNGANLYYNKYDPNWCYFVRTSQQDYEKMQQPTTTPQATTSSATTSTTSTEATSVYLKGSFNSWSTSNPFYTTSASNVISTSMSLSAGTYTFKVYNNGTWLGNNGSFTDTTTTSSSGGWLMENGKGNCTLVATGGYYTFNFNTSTNKLIVLYSPTKTNSAKALTSSNDRDINSDGKFDVKDVTCLQKYCSRFITLTNSQLAISDANNDGKVDIRDCTVLQKLLIGSGITIEQAKNYLSLYYRYSSYDCYQALKKACKNSADTATLGALANDLLSVVDPSNVDGQAKNYTVYFENKNNWSKVYAYCWGSGAQASWPGTLATYVGKNSYGNSIYSYTVNVEDYGSIIFSDGSSNQTKDISITADNTCYYPTTTDSKAAVTSYTFNSSMIVG